MMKPGTAERFRGMRWLFLRDNSDTYSSKRGVSETHPRPIFDTMPDLQEETAETLVKKTYAKVAAHIAGTSVPEEKETPAEFLEEVNQRRKLKEWREGKSFHQPAIAALGIQEKSVLNSHLHDPHHYQHTLRESAQHRLERIFEPSIWTQLQEIKRMSSSNNPQLHRLPSLRTAQTSRKAVNTSQEELPSVIRRKHYGRWYVPPSDWNSRFHKAISASERNSSPAKAK